MDLNGTSSILEAQKDKRACTVMIMAGDGETVVQVHTSPE
jgi:hypothetical protein